MNHEFLKYVFTLAGAKEVYTQGGLKALWSCTHLIALIQCERFWPNNYSSLNYFVPNNTNSSNTGVIIKAPPIKVTSIESEGGDSVEEIITTLPTIKIVNLSSYDNADVYLESQSRKQLKVREPDAVLWSLENGGSGSGMSLKQPSYDVASDLEVDLTGDETPSSG